MRAQWVLVKSRSRNVADPEHVLMRVLILSMRQIRLAELGQRPRNAFVPCTVFLLTMRVFTVS
ncbi:hypothetical protein NORO109296_18875 [Nocardiopsis rhodophaea]